MCALAVYNSIDVSIVLAHTKIMTEIHTFGIVPEKLKIKKIT